MLGVLDTPVVLQQLSRLSRIMRILDTHLVLLLAFTAFTNCGGLGHPFGAPVAFTACRTYCGFWAPMWCSYGFHGFHALLWVLGTHLVFLWLSRLSRIMVVLDTHLVLLWLSRLSRLIVGFGHPFGAPMAFMAFTNYGCFGHPFGAPMAFTAFTNYVGFGHPFGAPMAFTAFTNYVGFGRAQNGGRRDHGRDERFKKVTWCKKKAPGPRAQRCDPDASGDSANPKNELD